MLAINFHVDRALSTSHQLFYFSYLNARIVAGMETHSIVPYKSHYKTTQFIHYAPEVNEFRGNLNFKMDGE